MLRAQVAALDTQVQLHDNTVNKIQKSFMDALRDRGIFEAESKAAAAATESAKKQLEATKATADALKEDNEALLRKMIEAHAMLAKSENPEVARMAQLQADQWEAEKKIQALEKKLKSTETDLGYARRAYQDGTNAFADVNAENAELKARTKELEQKASENLLRIHQTNQQAEVDEFRRLWQDQQAITRDRERELERIREELRLLKNGRRETRQQSVPRSPRMGVISPRPGTARGVSGQQYSSTAVGAGSRGTSPATPAALPDAAAGSPFPGMTYFNQQSGSGRWGHLRD